MKRKILYLLFAISIYTIANSNAQIKLVWQVDKAKIWEEDWLLELLSGLEFESIEDGNFEKLVDNSIIVISPPRDDKASAYFKKLHEMHYKFGIILLSDECYKCPTDFYEYAQFVFRNYWHKQFTRQDNVICFGLGYKTGFWQDDSQKLLDSAHRQYTWSFAGQISGKPTRSAMISDMKRVPNHFIHEIYTWNDSRSLGVTEYQNLLLNSIFVPSPTGYWNLDSFRIWEALECGCIPIVEKFPLDYFGKFLGDHPFLVVDSWPQAAQEVANLLADPVRLEARRLECYQWWIEYKKRTNSTFLQIINKTLNKGEYEADNLSTYFSGNSIWSRCN